MIVLKILLFILLAVLGLILLVLIMPVDGEVSFIGGKLKYKVNLWVINVMDSDGGGILGWLKKRKSDKKKHKKPRTKKVRTKKQKESKTSEQLPMQVIIPDSVTSVATETGDRSAEESASFNSSASESDEPVLGTDLSENDDNDYDIPGEDSGKADNKSEKKKKKDNNKDDSDDDGGEKRPLGDKIDKLVDIWGSAKNPLCLIFKAFKFSDLYIDFVIANEDACKCALNYGRLSAVTYRGLALMSRIFTVRLKTVDIQPGFGMKKGRFDVAFRMRFRVGTFVIAGLWFLITYIFRVFVPGKLRSRKEKKSAAAQK